MFFHRRCTWQQTTLPQTKPWCKTWSSCSSTETTNLTCWTRMVPKCSTPTCGMTGLLTLCGGSNPTGRSTGSYWATISEYGRESDVDSTMTVAKYKCPPSFAFTADWQGLLLNVSEDYLASSGWASLVCFGRRPNNLSRRVNKICPKPVDDESGTNDKFRCRVVFNASSGHFAVHGGLFAENGMAAVMGPVFTWGVCVAWGELRVLSSCFGGQMMNE